MMSAQYSVWKSWVELEEELEVELAKHTRYDMLFYNNRKHKRGFTGKPGCRRENLNGRFFLRLHKSIELLHVSGDK